MFNYVFTNSNMSTGKDGDDGKKGEIGPAGPEGSQRMLYPIL